MILPYSIIQQIIHNLEIMEKRHYLLLNKFYYTKYIALFNKIIKIQKTIRRYRIGDRSGISSKRMMIRYYLIHIPFLKLIIIPEKIINNGSIRTLDQKLYLLNWLTANTPHDYTVRTKRDIINFLLLEQINLKDLIF